MDEREADDAENSAGRTKIGADKVIRSALAICFMEFGRV